MTSEVVQIFRPHLLRIHCELRPNIRKLNRNEIQSEHVVNAYPKYEYARSYVRFESYGASGHTTTVGKIKCWLCTSMSKPDSQKKKKTANWIEGYIAQHLRSPVIVGFVWNFSQRLTMMTSADIKPISVKQNHMKRSPNGRPVSAIYRTPCNVELLKNSRVWYKRLVRNRRDVEISVFFGLNFGFEL